MITAGQSFKSSAVEGRDWVAFAHYRICTGIRRGTFVVGSVLLLIRACPSHISGYIHRAVSLVLHEEARDHR